MTGLKRIKAGLVEQTRTVPTSYLITYSAQRNIRSIDRQPSPPLCLARLPSVTSLSLPSPRPALTQVDLLDVYGVLELLEVLPVGRDVEHGGGRVRPLHREPGRLRPGGPQTTG